MVNCGNDNWVTTGPLDPHYTWYKIYSKYNQEYWAMAGQQNLTSAIPNFNGAVIGQIVLRFSPITRVCLIHHYYYYNS